MDTRDALAAFQEIRDRGVSDTAAAILVLAAAVRRITVKADDTVGHEICMGIRHALFGSGDPSSTIYSLAELGGEVTVNLHQ